MKKTILFIITLFSVVFLHAQTVENNPYNLPLSNEEFFKQAEIVFEGYFIKVAAGYNPKENGNYSDGYRIMAYKAQKIYKGAQYTEGDTIYITHKGGYSGMENIVENPNEQVGYYTPSVLSKNKIECGIVTEYSPCIFFLVSSDFPDDENSKYFKHKKHKQLKGCLIICGNIIAGLNDLVFRQRENFYNYMKQFEGFTVPKVEPLSEKQSAITPTKAIHIDSVLQQYDSILDSDQYKMIKEKWEVKKKALKNPTKSSEYNTLTLQIANQQEK
jgi:hypothetical protein